MLLAAELPERGILLEDVLDPGRQDRAQEDVGQLGARNVPASREGLELELHAVVGGLGLERALEVGPKPVTGPLGRLGFGAQPGNPRLNALLLDFEGGDLRVARRNRGVGAGELAGESVPLGLGRGPAPGYFGQASREVLPLPIERLVGGLQRGVLGHDLLEFLHPVGMLLGELALFADLSLERGCPRAMAVEIQFGLLEKLLIPLEHPALLAVRLEQLGEIEPQPCLYRLRLVELRLHRAARGLRVGGPPGAGSGLRRARRRHTRRFGRRRHRWDGGLIGRLLLSGEGPLWHRSLRRGA